MSYVVMLRKGLSFFILKVHALTGLDADSYLFIYTMLKTNLLIKIKNNNNNINNNDIINNNDYIIINNVIA